MKAEKLEICSFRKKPVVIEAVQLDETSERAEAVRAWLGFYNTKPLTSAMRPGCVLIHTLEGDMLAAPGDWVIRGVKGEFYPCKPDIFEATYDRA